MKQENAKTVVASKPAGNSRNRIIHPPLTDAIEEMEKIILSNLLELSANLREEQIDHEDYILLRCLQEESLCMTEIANKLATSGANATLIVSRLNKLNLVERRVPEEDRRRVAVRLSKKGSALVNELSMTIQCQVAEALHAADCGDEDRYQNLCRDLGRAIEKQVIIRPPGKRW